ncbi:MAG TPA: STAS domain-containing protein [Desulfuromonadales bacterium]|nr:STAS domain-containing protein [Desulfuromonadales bacterium]
MNNYSINKHANPDGSITVTLAGALSIETCAELHKALSTSLDESQQVTLDLRAVESIDMTGLQAICSGCKTAAKMGRRYDCEPGAMPDCMISYGTSLGGPKGLICDQNDNKPCIWYGGIR